MPPEHQAMLAIKTWVGWDTEEFELGGYDDHGNRYAFGIVGLHDGSGNDLFLQFNQVYCSDLLDDSICIAAAVYAMRFNVCSGWFPFVLNNTNFIPLLSLGSDYLHFRNFTDSQAAQTYCKTFPECGGYSWEKVRTLGVPYSVVSQRHTLIWRNRDLLTLKEWPWEQVQRIISENKSTRE